MKKAISIILSVSILMAMYMPTYAAPSNFNASKFVPTQEQINTLAYMDLECANAEMKEEIIKARMELIYSQDWVVDGINGYVLDEKGSVVEEVPHFSELFPSDWSVPNIVNVSASSDMVAPAQPQGAGVHVYYNDWLTLSVPSASVNSPSFGWVSTSGPGYRLISLTTGGEISFAGNPTFNVGYTNTDTGTSLGWKANIPNRYSFTISNLPEETNISVRASTYDTPGEWWVTFFGSYDDGSLS